MVKYLYWSWLIQNPEQGQLEWKNARKIIWTAHRCIRKFRSYNWQENSTIWLTKNVSITWWFQHKGVSFFPLKSCKKCKNFILRFFDFHLVKKFWVKNYRSLSAILSLNKNAKKSIPKLCNDSYQKSSRIWLLETGTTILINTWMD